MHFPDIFHGAGEEFVEGPAGDAELAVGFFGLDGQVEHEFLVGVLHGLELVLGGGVTQRGALAASVLLGHAAPADVVLDVGLGDGLVGREVLGVVVVVEDEEFLDQLLVDEVHDYQAFFLVGDAAFVADVGPSQRVVPSYHHAPYLRLLQLLDRRLCLAFQLVLENLEAVENQVSLDVLAGKSFHLLFTDRFIGHCQNPKPVGRVFLQHFVVVLWHRGGLHHVEHHLGGPFG